MSNSRDIFWGDARGSQPNNRVDPLMGPIGRQVQARSFDRGLLEQLTPGLIFGEIMRELRLWDLGLQIG